MFNLYCLTLERMCALALAAVASAMVIYESNALELPNIMLEKLDVSDLDRWILFHIAHDEFPEDDLQRGVRMWELAPRIAGMSEMLERHGHNEYMLYSYKRSPNGLRAFKYDGTLHLTLYC